MTYLPDTNAVIAVLKNQPASVRHRLRRARPEGASIAVSSVVLFELWYGVARSERRSENAERLRVFLSADIGVFPFDEEDAKTAGDLRASLETAGRPIGSYDLLIATVRRSPFAVRVEGRIFETAGKFTHLHVRRKEAAPSMVPPAEACRGSANCVPPRNLG